MQQILLFSLLGLGSGALIAGIALGVVLTSRGSGIINLATGGMAMLAGYAFWALRVDLLHWSTAPALVASLVIVLIVGALTELVAFRPLRTAPPLAKLVSSLGVLLVLQASMLLAFGTTPQPEPQVLPQNTVKVLSAVIPVDRFILTGIVIVLAAALAALYRFTRFGLATRAASENEVVAMLGGLSPNRLSMLNTLLASLIAGGVGILAASITQLESETLPLQIVPALAAALLARFTSFGIACAAGIGLGILESLIEYLTSQSWFPQSGGVALPGVQELIVFVLIVVFMYLRGARLPTRGELVEQRLPEAPRPRRLAMPALVVTAVSAVALVVLPFDFREALVNSLIGTLIALSLVVITGFVGQISVLQLTLAGVSGFAISHLAVNAGIAFPLAPILGAGAALVLGLITAASALRVRGVSLAVVTLAAVVAITNFGFTNTTWGGGQTGSPVPEPRLLGLDLGPRAAFRGLDGNLASPIFGWLVLAVTVALCVLVGLLRRGTLGQRMLAVRSNERAAAAAAIDPRTVKLIAFGISSVIAGLAGALYAYNFGSVSADRFDPFTALSLIAFAYAGGITLISGAAFAGLISTQALFPYALDKWFGINGNWFLLFGGAILIITLIQNPEGVAGAFYKRFHKRPPIRPPEPEPVVGLAALDVPPDDLAAGAFRRGKDAERAAAASVRPRPDTPASPILAVRDLSVSFGGVHALQDVDLEVGNGELVGLIGPNGAGKTTLIDAVTGFVPFTGRVELGGEDISSLSAHARARRGLSRTWQNTDLFDDLEVGENVAVASASASEASLELVDLDWASDAMPDQLPEGTRKLVGVARALAGGVGGVRVVCLDEPAAGLDARESEELGRTLRELADRGQSTLLIDHDMGLVLSICDRVVVLEFGRVIADGPPEAVRRDERVIAAYLRGGRGRGPNKGDHSMTQRSLEELLRSIPSTVDMLRNAQVGPNVYPGVPAEYTNWRDEQYAWQHTCALYNQSFHMAELAVEGPDAVALLSRLGVNTFDNFAVDKAKQFVPCTPDGYVIGDVILFHLAEHEFNLVGRAPVLNWVTYHAKTGGYDVQVTLDQRTALRTDGRRRHYRFQVQGPHAMDVIARALGAQPPDLKFFNLTTARIAGVTVRALRHGMAGQPGWELFGPWDDYEPVHAAIVAAGEEFGLRLVGGRAYSSNALESGWIPSPLPAVYTGDGLRPYREWLPADGYEGSASIGGSFVSDKIEDYYFTPWDLGYGHLVKFDHDFIGREALERLAGEDHRHKVTIALHDDDVADTIATMFHKTDRAKFIDWPSAVYSMHPFDQVMVNGDTVGVSTWFGYSSNEAKMLTLAVVDAAHAKPGTEVTLLWGEEGGGTSKPTVEPHVQREIRGVVSPVPYVEVVRQAYAPDSWRSAAV